MKRARGVTLTEAVVSMAVLGLVSLTVVNVNKEMMDVSRSTQNTQELQFYAQGFLTRLGVMVKNAGAGLSTPNNVSLCQTVFATPVAALAPKMPDLIFLYKDNAPTGLDPGDYWGWIHAVTRDSVEGIAVDVYQADNWGHVRDGGATAVPAQSLFFRLTPGIHISELSFTLFDSQTPPNVTNQSPNASSAVRILLSLTKEKTTISMDKTVILESLLYGPHS